MLQNKFPQSCQSSEQRSFRCSRRAYPNQARSVERGLATETVMWDPWEGHVVAARASRLVSDRLSAVHVHAASDALEGYCITQAFECACSRLAACVGNGSETKSARISKAIDPQADPHDAFGQSRASAH